MKVLNIILAAAVAITVAAAPGCSLLKKRVEKTENVKFKVSPAGKTAFVIENTNGKINIIGVTDSSASIEIEAEITAQVKHDELDKPIENVTIKIDSSGSNVAIETQINRTNSGLFRNNNAPEVNYNIRIPAGMKVKTETVNGSITITRVNGDIKSESVNGRMNILGCPGYLELESVNGTVICNIDSVTAGINVNVTNGEVKIGGLKKVNAEVRASTIHGKVTVKDLEFSEVTNEKKSLNGILGTGGNQIRVEAVNGKITFDASKFVPKKDDSFELKIDFDDEEPIIINGKKNKDGDIDVNISGDENSSDETKEQQADSVKRPENK